MTDTPARRTCKAWVLSVEIGDGTARTRQCGRRATVAVTVTITGAVEVNASPRCPAHTPEPGPTASGLVVCTVTPLPPPPCARCGAPATSEVTVSGGDVEPTTWFACLAHVPYTVTVSPRWPADPPPVCDYDHGSGSAPAVVRKRIGAESTVHLCAEHEQSETGAEIERFD